jgi:predicted nucleotidyltransferase
LRPTGFKKWFNFGTGSYNKQMLGRVEQIYLFGSYAYGDPHADSDLDLYVVMKDDAPYREIEAEQKITLAVYSHHSHQSMPTDILVLKKNSFRHRLGALTLEHNEDF